MSEVFISKTYSGYRTCYHTDENCGQLCDETRTVSRDMAVDRMDLELCGHCDGVKQVETDMSLYQNAKDADLGELR